MVRRRRFAALMAAIVAVSVVTVFAHIKVSKLEPAADSTLPAPPTRVQVWFTESPDPTVSRLALACARGAVRLSGFHVNADRSIAATIDGTLADGLYTVRWQAAGDDGHVLKGEYGFTVKRAN